MSMTGKRSSLYEDAMSASVSSGLNFIRRQESGSVVFFFQAEDGIRDVAVTGVQTCALPISTPVFDRIPNGDSCDVGGAASPPMVWSECSTNCVGALDTDRRLVWRALGRSAERTGERRVGEECRSPWSPDH